jgi:glycosyltransferase involved in cell wall biosynthesis
MAFVDVVTYKRMSSVSSDHPLSPLVAPARARGPVELDLLVVMPSGRARGGAEEALMQFCRCWSGHSSGRLSVVFLEAGELVSAIGQLGAETFVVPAGRVRAVKSLVGAVLGLRATILRERPNIVLSWMTKAHVYAAPACFGTDTPALYYQHALPDDGWIDRLSRVFPAAGALACSRFIAELQQARVTHRVVAVAVAADVERFSSDKLPSSASLKRKFGFDPDRPLVGIVGRLQHWKGMHVFLEAMALVRHVNPQTQGVVVGGIHELEPDYRTWLKSRHLTLELGDAVRLVGAQTNVPEWMQAMDVVVHASDREPFGIVVAEAMALGKPVVATIPGGRPKSSIPARMDCLCRGAIPPDSQ